MAMQAPPRSHEDDSASTTDWAKQMRDVFYGGLKKQQMAMGQHSWEFLNLLGLDLQRPIDIARAAALRPANCPRIPALMADLAAEVHRTIR